MPTRQARFFVTCFTLHRPDVTFCVSGAVGRVTIFVSLPVASEICHPRQTRPSPLPTLSRLRWLRTRLAVPGRRNRPPPCPAPGFAKPERGRHFIGWGQLINSTAQPPAICTGASFTFTRPDRPANARHARRWQHMLRQDTVNEGVGPAPTALKRFQVEIGVRFQFFSPSRPALCAKAQC